VKEITGPLSMSRRTLSEQDVKQKNTRSFSSG
jgi:hypothetical protein